MYLCIAYDISSNRLRVKAAKMCRRIGLVRLQRSVFVGETRADLLAELEQTFRPVLPVADKLVIIRLEKSEYHNILQMSKNPALQHLRIPLAVWNL
ncbi:MAG: CRISPR-associated endonuclease Cas2 [Saprospiraceae bacterium]|nr:CRISPR-associated endonuclease Cas2 [Saprospiraceae bacterium]